MKEYTLFTTADVTEEMLASFHSLSRVGNLKPVEMDDMLIIPGLDWENSIEPDETETKAKVKTKLKKGLRLNRKRLNKLKLKFKWGNPEERNGRIN
ncbi:MAG: hypothetical protein GY941_15755 [Planctomycetes bacterium]|nr:hypothetical protein [Planctomycetota bacterium]